MSPQRKSRPSGRTPAYRSGRRRANSAPDVIPRGRFTGAVRYLGIALTALLVSVIVYLVATARENTRNAHGTTEMADAGRLLEVVNPEGMRQELIPYTGMNVSFNPDTHQPNWVAWELLAEEVGGDSGREPGFLVDAAVDGCAMPEDYRNTGFDRGHMAPAGDMKWHPQAMRESFYMTNVCPQAPDLNRGAWKKLEEKCRARVKADSALVIICGPVFDRSGPSARIGGTGVAVPSGFFKVILSPFAEHPWSIGFVMPNSYVAGGMQSAAVSVDKVEELTGYDFFSALPDSLENAIEARCDFNTFSHIPRHMK